MQLTKRQLEFWSFVIILCLSVSVLVLIIDFGIKAAILEESLRLRVKIDEWEVANGRRPKAPDDRGIDDDNTVNTDIPGDVLVVDTPGMEKGHGANGTKAPSHSPRRQRRTQPNGADTDSAISTGNE